MSIYSRCRSSNWRMVSVVLLASIGVPPAHGQSYDACDNKIEFEKGEKAGGPFFGVGYLMLAHALAETFCGAPATGMSSKILGYVEKQGCGPDTPIYSESKEDIARLERSDLETLMKVGDPTRELSTEQVEENARAGVEDMGGCPALLKIHKEGFN